MRFHTVVFYSGVLVAALTIKAFEINVEHSENGPSGNLNRCGTRDSIIMQPGEEVPGRFRIGRVIISGNTRTQERVIRRELYTIPGDYFSRENLIRSVSTLQQLNYFKPESIQPELKFEDDETVNIVYNLEEQSSDTYNASVGYTPGFGLTGGLGVSFNNFDLRRPFRGGAGQQLQLDWQFGEPGTFRTFRISFTEPWLYDTPTLFGVDLFDTRQRIFIDHRRTGAALRIGRRFQWPDDYFRGTWIIRWQRNDVEEGQDIFLPGISTHFGVAQIIGRNSTDHPVFPTRGSDISITNEIAGGPLLPGTVDFHRHMMDANWYASLFNSKRIVLAVKTKTASLFPINDASRIPPVELFFMGGTGLGQFNTIPLRGYKDRSVGPVDDEGNPVGGQAIAAYTVELRYAPILDPFTVFLLAFAETGNVWEELRDIRFRDLRRSAGFGIRINVPWLGMIGFDYAYGFDTVFAPPDRRPEKPGWQYHIQIGRGVW